MNGGAFDDENMIPLMHFLVTASKIPQSSTTTGSFFINIYINIYYTC